MNTTFFGTDADGDGAPNFFGTSAAAPHVAGLMGLLLSMSTSPSRAEVEQALITTAMPFSGNGGSANAGLADVQAARNLLNPVPTPTPTPTAEPTVSPSPTGTPTPSPSATPTPVPSMAPDRDGDGVPDDEDLCPDQSAQPEELVPALVGVVIDLSRDGCPFGATPTPSVTPTVTPTPEPTATPAPTATPIPTVAPTVTPSASPTPIPSMAPDRDGDGVPDDEDLCPDQSAQPEELVPALIGVLIDLSRDGCPFGATPVPSVTPTVVPTVAPTATPLPTASPMPSAAPTVMPTASPTSQPTFAPPPTASPTISPPPTAAPTVAPTSPPLSNANVRATKRKHHYFFGERLRCARG